MAEQGTYKQAADAKRKSTLKSVEGYVFGGVFVVILLVGGYFVAQELGSKPTPVTQSKTPVADTPAELIGYNSAGAWETDLKTIWGVAVDPDGNIWACGDGGLRKYTPKGDLLDSIATDAPVRTITFHDDKRYLGVKNTVIVQNAQGNPVAVWDKLGAHANITSIVFKDDRAYLGDVGRAENIGHEIIVTDMDGAVVKRFGSQISDQVNGLHITGPHLDLAWHEDLLWVTNPGRHNVQAYNTEGTLKRVTGRQSFRYIGYTGCCNPSALAVLPDGTLITTEKGMPRVKEIDAESGDFSIFVAAEDEWRKRNRKYAYAVDVAVADDGTIYLADKKETGKQLVIAYQRKPQTASEESGS